MTFLQNVYWGIAVLTVIAGAVTLTSAVLVRRMSPGSTQTEIALDLAIVSTALLMFMGSILPLLQLGAVHWMLLLSVTMGGVAVWRDGRQSLRLLVGCLRAGLLLLRSSWALWIVLLLGLLTLARGLSIPQLSWDGLTYHLAYPATWIKHGAVVRLEGGGCWETYETFPKGTEALTFLAMLPFGRDYLVNLVNLPLWIALGLALRSAGQRLGLSRRAQDTCTLVVLTCPVFSAYITPAYVEVSKCFAFCAALACGLRALTTRTPRFLVPLGIAFGIALAIKLTSLAWLPWPVLCALFVARHNPRGVLRYGATGGALGLGVAAPWYVHNVAICGNPIYPAGLPFFSQGSQAGSIAAQWAMSDTSVLAQGSGGLVIDYLLAPQAVYPLGPGLLYLGVVLALPLLCLFARGAARLLAIALLGLSVFELVIYLLTPYNGIYIAADTRFLAPSLIPAVLGCAVAIRHARAWVRVLLGTAATAHALYALRGIPTLRDHSLGDAGMLTAVLLLLAMGIAVFATSTTVGATRRVGSMLVTALIVGAVGTLPWVLSARERTRFAAHQNRYDLHPLPPASMGLWKAISKLPPSRIAFAVGGIDSTEGWFFYPLFGADLRHDVTYVDVEADGELRACHRRGLIRDKPDRKAWLKRLERERIDYLVVRSDPIESEWADALPERFELQDQAKTDMRLYRIIRDQDAQR